jgi:KaiC/GvpD/RAD55 family RecA-like ATPase
LSERWKLNTSFIQGDNGAGKTVAMMALADQAEAAGDTCIFYDPAMPIS